MILAILSTSIFFLIVAILAPFIGIGLFALCIWWIIELMIYFIKPNKYDSNTL